jgi:hypothetical protein
VAKGKKYTYNVSLKDIEELDDARNERGQELGLVE